MDGQVEGGEEVFWRGLRQGTGIGALMGAVAGAAIPCVGCVESGEAWSAVTGGSLPAMLLLAVPGLIVGAMVGFGCALVPALALSVARGYFRRHGRIAAACTISCGLALLLGLGSNRPISAQDYEQFALLAVPLAIGLVLAAGSTHYVLTGKGFRVGPRRAYRRPGRLG